MVEYINKAELLEQIGNYSDRIGIGQYGDEWCFLDTITNMPTIGIVRCKECIYFAEWTDGEKFCGHLDGMSAFDDGFCSDGERRK